MEVRSVKYEDTKPFILGKHYAQRMPSISYSFGLYANDDIIGVCTFGKPASNQLTEGVCGVRYKGKVYELNRLILNDGLPKNTASFFISQCLKKLKKFNLIIISYSDLGMNHNGYVYQASNFLFTGTTKQRTDKFSGVGKHSRHYDKLEVEKYRKIRTPKNRYVYFSCDKKKRKEYLENLNYPILPYPKGENEKYELGSKQTFFLKDIKTGEVIKESELTKEEE